MVVYYTNELGRYYLEKKLIMIFHINYYQKKF